MHSPDGKSFKSEGRISFDWVLQERAIQRRVEVPRQFDHFSAAGPFPRAACWYGTTPSRDRAMLYPATPTY